MTLPKFIITIDGITNKEMTRGMYSPGHRLNLYSMAMPLCA